MPRRHTDPTRRTLVGGAIAATLAPASAFATDGGLAQAAIATITNGRAIKPGRVMLTLPELAENGHSVSLAVAVDSPMTASDYVKFVHIVSDKNPIADVMKFHLSPRSGRARVAANIRLAGSQTVTAIAEMSDGSLWSGTADVIVTLAACVDGG